MTAEPGQPTGIADAPGVTPHGPLVSVIIPAYQQPDFLNAALECVATQTYPHTEILVIDDASGPQYTSKYRLPARARLIISQRRIARASITRNLALRQIHGTYVAFLDQDDLWQSDKLALQVAALQARPDALAHYSHFQRVDVNLAPLPRQDDFTPMSDDPLRQLIIRNAIPHSSVLLPRHTFDRVGLFDESITGAADWDMWLRIVAAGPMLGDPRPLLLRRIHDAQWSRSSLMMARGAAAVMEKASNWIPKIRPDLRRLLTRRRARWLREVGRAQLADRACRSDTLNSLLQSARLWPFDPRTYALMCRSALRRNA